MSEPGIYTDIGKGRCVIILHTGCQNGLVQGALTIFKSDAKSSDYHGYMNGLTFYKWVHEKLKDKLLPNSVVVWTTHLTTAFKLSRNHYKVKCRTGCSATMLNFPKILQNLNCKFLSITHKNSPFIQLMNS